MRKVYLVLLGLSLLLVGLLLVAVYAQDDRALRIARWDTTIDNMVTASNQFDVTERYSLEIHKGPYQGASRDISMSLLTQISNVKVYQDDRPLLPGCNAAPGTYCTSQTPDNYLRITYYFDTAAQTGDHPTIQIEYTVNGALRSYAEGDELFWSVIPPDRGIEVQESHITLTLPTNISPIGLTSQPELQSSQSGNSITWTTQAALNPNDGVEIDVRYPHDPAMIAPAWQAAYDSSPQSSAIPQEGSTTNQAFPLVSLVIGLLLGIAGPIVALVVFMKFGRDPQLLSTVPEYLTGPPSDEPPGLAGWLLDFNAGFNSAKRRNRYLMATAIDLARRGYIVIEHLAPRHFLKPAQWIFHRTNKDDRDLSHYEWLFLWGMFIDCKCTPKDEAGQHRCSISMDRLGSRFLGTTLFKLRVVPEISKLYRLIFHFTMPITLFNNDLCDQSIPQPSYRFQKLWANRKYPSSQIFINRPLLKAKDPFCACHLSNSTLPTISLMPHVFV